MGVNVKTVSRSVNSEYLSMCLVKLIKKETAAITADMFRKKEQKSESSWEAETGKRRRRRRRKEQTKKSTLLTQSVCLLLLLKCSPQTMECTRPPPVTVSLDQHRSAAAAVIKLAHRRQQGEWFWCESSSSAATATACQHDQWSPEYCCWTVLRRQLEERQLNENRPLMKDNAYRLRGRKENWENQHNTQIVKRCFSQ